MDSYQVVTPSTWVVSPAGPDGESGPCERAVRNTPVTSTGSDGEPETLDVMRAVRSFDPCLLCAGH